MGPLTRKSFELHASLSRELGGVTQYRRLSCEAVAVAGARNGPPKQAKLQGVEWADLGVRGSKKMGDESTIAQVHPKLLCEALWAEAEKAGSKLLVGNIHGVQQDKGVVNGVQVGDVVIPAAVVVIALGPWSGSASKWLGLPPTLGQKYHSVVMKSDRILSQAVRIRISFPK